MKRIFLSFLALMLFGPAVRAQVAVASYAFTGNANDAQGNHAAVHGAQLTADRHGFANSAFLFDGKQSFLLAPNKAALNSASATVSFWVKPTAFPAQGEAFLISNGGWQERLKISLPNHGKPVFTTHAGGACCSDMDSGIPLALGVWTMVTMTHDGVNDKIYLNGVETATKAVAGSLDATVHPLGIGYDAVDKGSFFDGAMDEVNLYDVALSAAEIGALYASQSVAPGLFDQKVADYPFTKSTRDVSGWSNDAVATNGHFTTDRFGFGNSAMAFDGASTEVVAANSAVLNSDYTTVSFWVKPNSLPANGEYFLLSNGGWQERWKISLPTHGKPVWTTNNSSGISDMDSGGGNELVAGKWSHVVMVHDGAKDLIYMNGVQVAEKVVTGTMNPTTKPLGIGFNPIDGGNWFDGMLDEVRVYNYALSAAQVAAMNLAQATSPGSGTDLVADYRLDGDGLDNSEFANHAYLLGGPIANRHGWAANASEGISYAENSVALNSDYTTINFWAKPYSFPASGEAFLFSNGGWQERLKISLPNHGKPVFTTHSGGACCSDMDSGTPLVLNAWTMVTMVHDGAKDIIYFNGNMVAEKAVTGTLDKTKYPLGIGWDPIDGASVFDGAMDDVQIFNKALDAAAIAALFATQNPAPTVGGNLVADYQFGGNTNDATAYKNNALAFGAQLADDRFGKKNMAYSFNGTSDGVLAANSPQQNSSFNTISFWVKPAAFPASGEAFILSNGGWQERWKVSLPNHGKPVFTTHSGGACCSDLDSGTPLVLNTWTHVAMTHDGAKDIIYINGVKANEKTATGNLDATTHPLGIGFDPIDNANYFNGSLDDVQLYNVALDAAAIAALYAAQNTPPVSTDTEAPSAPLNISGVVDFTNIYLSWNAATDNTAVAGYNVYQDGAKIGTTADAQFEVYALAPLTEYEFGVSAVDAAGNESLISYLKMTSGVDQTPDLDPPSVPANLAASTGSNSILFSWDASTDNTQVAGYVVSLDGVFYDSVPGNQLSVFIGGLLASTPYSLEVYAFDLAGNNSAPADLDATTEAPIVTAEAGMVAHYPFEGNANDATPYQNHGVIGGNPTFITASHTGGGAGLLAIKFDGQMDSVLAPNAVQLISDFATVSFWIRVDETNLADAEAYILDFGHWSQRWKISLPQHLKIVWTTNGNNVQFPSFISDMDSGGGNELVKSFWWHVTMVHDGVNDQIFVNGQLANTKPTATKLNPTSFPLGMGNNPIEGGQYFNGALDELKIYNKSLTAAEILNLFTFGTTGADEPNIAGLVVDVFPNPTTDFVFVKHSFDGLEPLQLRVFDVAGRQLDDVRFDKNEIPAGQFSVKTGGLPQGTYFLNFILGGQNLGSVKFDKK